MRLFLAINRHGLPPANILWTLPTADHTTSPHGPQALTIAQLLERVNGTVPLESGEWGLEDYIVEVNAFECLHFEEATNVLQDEDHVRIRPLSTLELRSRKLSGRHQITSDGRHLIDGVSFGKSFLRLAVADRPEVSIPPRKRRRLIYDDDRPDTNQQLMLMSGTEIPDQDEDEQDDGDFVPGQDVDFEGEDGEESDWSEKFGDEEVELNDFDQMGAAEVAAELAQLSPARSALEQDLRKRKRHPTDRLGSHQTAPTGGDSLSLSRRTDKYQNHRQRGGLKHSKELAMFLAGAMDSDDLEQSTSPSGSEEDSDAEPDSEDDSGSGETTTGASTTDESESVATDSSSTSSAGSSSDSSSGEHSSESESDPAPSHRTTQALAESKCAIPSLAPQEAATTSQTPAKPLHKTPPGHGLRSTRQRNQRRRLRKKLEHLKRIGELPPNATTQDLESWMQDRNGVESIEKAALPLNRTESGPAPDQAFQKKRQELLAAIASGGVEVAAAAKPPATTEAHKTVQEADFGHALDKTYKGTAQESLSTTETAGLADSAPPTGRRRTKLDLASSRRMLFGSLGLRAPNSKDEELKLREAWMKNSIPVNGKPANLQSTQAEGMETPTDPDSTDGDDDWKTKLTLMAVECYDDNIRLSTPPFPFVQHWDRAQHTSGKKSRRGGAGKKRKRNSQHYYEGEEPYHDDYQGRADWLQYAAKDDELNYDEAGSGQAANGSEELHSNLADGAANDQLLRDVNDTRSIPTPSVADEDDLPALPTDLESYAVMREGDALAGTVVAFKQLVMTADWQPSISEYRTALVDKVLDDGSLQVTLAKRDRGQKEKLYNEDTGERVYGKFDMPGNEEDEGDDDGVLELQFSEMRDSRIIRLPPLEDRAHELGSRSGEKGEAEELASVTANGIPNIECTLRQREGSSSNAAFDMTTGQEDATKTFPINGARSEQDPQTTATDKPNGVGASHDEEPRLAGTDNPPSPRFNGLDLVPASDERGKASRQSIPTGPVPALHKVNKVDDIAGESRRITRSDDVLRSIPALDGGFSDGELPKVDALFSSAQTSLESAEDESIKVSQAVQSSPAASTRSNTRKKLRSSVGLHDDEADPSQSPSKAQVIDLTLNSDGPDAQSNDEQVSSQDGCVGRSVGRQALAKRRKMAGPGVKSLGGLRSSRKK